MSYQDLKECKIITAFITPFHEDGSLNFDAIVEKGISNDDLSFSL